MKSIEMDHKKEKARLKRLIPNTYKILKKYKSIEDILPF